MEKYPIGTIVTFSTVQELFIVEEVTEFRYDCSSIHTGHKGFKYNRHAVRAYWVQLWDLVKILYKGEFIYVGIQTIHTIGNGSDIYIDLKVMKSTKIFGNKIMLSEIELIKSYVSHV